MTEISIPKDALEAAQRDAAAAIHRLVDPDTRAHELTEDEVGEIVLAACEAMLRAWPGMRMMVDIDTGDDAALKLPLTQENTNAEA